MNIFINRQEDGPEVSVKLSGEIDAYTAPQVREELMNAVKNVGVRMVVDLSEVTYMDSTGLGVFVGLFKVLKTNKGQLCFTGMTDRIKRLFEITGLQNVININTGVEGGIR